MFKDVQESPESFFFFFKCRFQDLRDSRMLLIITPEEKASLCVNIPLPLSVWACPIPHCKHCEGGDCFHLFSVSSAQHNMLLKEECLKHPLYVTKMKPGALSSKFLSTTMDCIRLNLVMDKAGSVLVGSEARLGRVLLLLPAQGEEQKKECIAMISSSYRKKRV